MSGEKKWKVYCYTNKVNGKKYVGITSARSLSLRAGRGAHYKGCRHFYFAIKKYGWESFSPEILADGVSKDAAKNLERYYIALLETQDPSMGYNIDDGGGVPTKVSPEGLESLRRAASGANNKKARAVVAFDLSGKKIGDFPCIVFAERHFGVKINWRHLKNQRGTCHEMIFRYKDDVGDIGQLPAPQVFKKFEQKLSRGDRSWRSTPVVLFDASTGDRIEEFTCIKYAEKYAGVPLSAVLRGVAKTANGFVCKYLSDVGYIDSLPKNELPVHETTSKAVLQYDLGGNLLNTFVSGMAAERETGVSHKTISNCVRHLCQTGGGFVWRLSGDDSPITPPKSNWDTRWETGAVKCTPVDQVDLETGDIIASYRSIGEAARAVGTYVTSIRKIIDHVGNNKSAKGFGWKYHLD